MRDFANFACVDWSGAVGERHAGIAVAICRAGDEVPALVPRDRRWSRRDVLDWVLRDMPADTLVGFDLGMSLPFVDEGAFFPGWNRSPPDARELWALVENMSDSAAHLSVGGFVDDPQVARYFRRHGGRRGDRFGDDGRGRFRRTELAQAAHGCRPYSNFNLVGAAQVGKSSLTGMRVLHRLAGSVAIWPFDPVPAAGSVVVEIYTTIAAMDAGRSPGRSKMRDYTALNAALARVGSHSIAGTGPIDDHRSDALLTAAWLRRVAGDESLWHPGGLDAVRHTEGWTFGAR